MKRDRRTREQRKADESVLIAEDCGSGIQGNRIDVFFADHETARLFGVQPAMAYLTEGGSYGAL